MFFFFYYYSGSAIGFLHNLDHIVSQSCEPIHACLIWFRQHQEVPVNLFQKALQLGNNW